VAAPAGDPRRPYPVRLLLDEMYPAKLAEQLREAGHDVVGVVERPGLVGRPDAEIARWARGQGRVVVTENVIDFASLDAAEHGGVLLLNARRWPRTPRGLARIRAAIDAWLRGRREGDSATVQWLSVRDARHAGSDEIG
jgi:hypothetical protein